MERKLGTIQELKSFQEKCTQYLPENLAIIVKEQASLMMKEPKGRRYTWKFQKFALSLYFLCPRSYRFLSSIMQLPSVRTLQRITENWQYEPGINDFVSSVIKVKIESFSEMDKYCILCADEMSIKSNITYNMKSDEILGFHDAGGGKKKFLSATSCLIFMAKGAKKKRKQPLSYNLVNGSCTNEELKNLIVSHVKKLREIGLKLICFITDRGSNFSKFARTEGVTPLTPYFTVDAEIIFYMFDTPHLLKALRNMLMQYIVKFGDKVASWADILLFYNLDKKLPIRTAYKLTEAHVNPTNFQKMKVKLAAQVLSRTVASSMMTYVSLNALPAQAVGTIELIEEIDKLFDLLNSSQLKAKKKYNNAFEGAAYQTEFLIKSKKFLSSLKFYDKKIKDCTKRMKCIDGFLITISALEQLWPILRKSRFQISLHASF